MRTREQLLGLGEHPTPPQRPPVRRSLRRQLRALTLRTVLTKVRDVGGLAVRLGQAPLLALAFAAVFPEASTGLIFVMVLSALWFGTATGVRELVDERPIWQREARVGVGVAPYLASKVLGLSGFVAVQCALLSSVLYVALDLGSLGFHLPSMIGVTSLVGVVGLSLGLFLSAALASAEAAVTSLPLALIPQIAFGGLLVPVKQMGTLAWGLSWLTATRYGFEAALKTGEHLHVPGARGLAAHEAHVSRFLWELGFRTAEAGRSGHESGRAHRCAARSGGRVAAGRRVVLAALTTRLTPGRPPSRGEMRLGA